MKIQFQLWGSVVHQWWAISICWMNEGKNKWMSGHIWQTADPRLQDLYTWEYFLSKKLKLWMHLRVESEIVMGSPGGTYNFLSKNVLLSYGYRLRRKSIFVMIGIQTEGQCLWLRTVWHWLYGQTHSGVTCSLSGAEETLVNKLGTDLSYWSCHLREMSS